MAASVHEAILARVAAALAAAGTAAGARITRGRVDALGPAELPAINVRRSPSQLNPFGGAGAGRSIGADVAVCEFELDLYCDGDGWETATDALHMQAHAALVVDAQLAQLGRGLRCIRTEPHAEPGEQTHGRLTVTYQMQALVAVQNLTQQLR